jgi:8-oxo-dGTP diphosphatase
MEEIDKLFLKKFGNKLRIRVSAIIIQNNKILLLKQKTNTAIGYLWLPPGGSLQFGESIEQAIAREVLEESNLKIQLSDFYTLTEYIKAPLHAVELFYICKIMDGNAQLGIDPELENEQILEEIAWLGIAEIEKIPADAKHQVLKQSEKLYNLISTQSA